MNNVYHLSEKNHDDELFTPRPMEKWRVMEGENWKTRRICVSTSIDGALAALLSSDSQPFGKHLFVHVPDDVDALLAKNKIFTPSCKQVPDVDATNERWIKCPTTMTCIGEIEVIDIDENVELSYVVDGTKQMLDAFKWKWVWVKAK